MSYKQFLFFLLFNLFLFKLSIGQEAFNGLRLGAGLGKNIYIGSQMDFNFAVNAFGKSEFGNGFNFELFKAVDQRNEFGIRYLNTELWSFKNNKTFAINSKFSEFALIYQRSFNDNIEIDYKSKFTFNGLLGLGYIRYASVVYSINEKGDFIPFSSVGDGYQPVSNPNYLIREKQATLSFLAGFNIGYRISSNFSLYYETSYSLAASNNFSGNLSLDSKIPTNGFSYSALTLYYNLTGKFGQLGCPRF